MYSVVIRDKVTRTELARYTYDRKGEAMERARDVKHIRLAQNRESVTVTVEKERDC